MYREGRLWLDASVPEGLGGEDLALRPWLDGTGRADSMGRVRRGRDWLRLRGAARLAQAATAAPEGRWALAEASARDRERPDVRNDWCRICFETRA